MFVLKRHYAVESVKATQAQFFKDAQVGDRLRVSVSLSSKARFSPEVKVENLTQGTERTMTMGLAYNGLSSLGLRELD